MLRRISKVPIVRILPRYNPIEERINSKIKEINQVHKKQLGREQTHKTTLLSIGLAPYFLANNLLISLEQELVKEDFNVSIDCIAYGLLGGDFINELKDKKDFKEEERKNLEESRDWALGKAEKSANYLGVGDIFKKAMDYSMIYENWEDARMIELQNGKLSKDLESVLGNPIQIEIDALKFMNFTIEETEPFEPRTLTQLTYRRVASLYHAASYISVNSWFKHTSLKEYEVSTNMLSKILPAALQVIYDDGNDLIEDWEARKPTPIILLSMNSAATKVDFSVEDFFTNPREYRQEIEQGIEDAYTLSKGYFSLVDKRQTLGAFNDLMKFKLSKQIDKGYEKAVSNSKIITS